MVFPPRTTPEMPGNKVLCFAFRVVWNTPLRTTPEIPGNKMLCFVFPSDRADPPLGEAEYRGSPRRARHHCVGALRHLTSNHFVFLILQVLGHNQNINTSDLNIRVSILFFFSRTEVPESIQGRIPGPMDYHLGGFAPTSFFFCF